MSWSTFRRVFTLTRRGRLDIGGSWGFALHVTAETAWGAVRRVRCPGHIAGVRSEWRLPAGPLGVDDACFADT
ncbi:MAG: hypothetical protein AB7K71_26515 [Polyangiaceae bacterium]